MSPWYIYIYILNYFLCVKTFCKRLRLHFNGFELQLMKLALRYACGIKYHLGEEFTNETRAYDAFRLRQLLLLRGR